MNRIKELRKQKGWTLSKLSSITNIAPNTLNQYELEKREPSIEIIYLLAKVFDVSVDYILCKDSNQTEKIENKPEENTVRIVGRNGVLKDYKVTEEQRKAFETLLSTITNDDLK